MNHGGKYNLGVSTSTVQTEMTRSKRDKLSGSETVGMEGWSCRRCFLVSGLNLKKSGHYRDI